MVSTPVISGLRTGLVGFPSVRLEGRRLYLRPPRPQDWAAWADLRAESRSFLTPWEPSWPADALSRRSFMQRLRSQVGDWREDRGYTMLIFANDDTLLGGISLTHVRRGVAQTGSLGYWIGAPFARRGYMKDAVCTILEFAFGAAGLHRVEAACLPSNEASRRLLESVGFRQEGFARAYLRIAGAWRDHLLFAMLTDEFVGKRANQA
ncbi:MAG: GNAT family N-acetyltransferase [Alphaproteobacteria bacterium]|jgi:ribosomal-protein-alanine N-acetyltransferase|nr:GNAT family N-acetyltransferase [Alphaproteobacteria bacterium]